MMGIVLLLVTLAFGLTGYLLPWDNRAYWGTVVTTQITGSAPVLGPYLQRLLGGEGVGVVTFARFFAAHVVLLPPITLLLIAIHVYLVRKHGVAPVAEETAPPKKFYPEQVFKDTVAFAIAFVALVLMAAFVDVPLERLADPTDTTYIPRPEWYFLFLFQMLKVFKGPLEIAVQHRSSWHRGPGFILRAVYRSRADGAPRASASSPSPSRHWRCSVGEL